MANYYPLIARAVAGLPQNTDEARRALYERARNALVAQLRGRTPTLNEAEIMRERSALDDAIRKAEMEATRKLHTTGLRPDSVAKERLPSSSVRSDIPSNNIVTLQDWLNQLRIDLQTSEPLSCPTCAETLSRETLEMGVCQSCKGRLVDETGSGRAKRWVLWGVIATVVVAVAIAILSGIFSGLGLFIGGAVGGSSNGGRPPILAILIFLVIFGGIAALIINRAGAIIKHFAPPTNASAQFALAALAKQLSKRGELQKAARFYAELVTYGFSDTFYVNTGRAYDCWKKLGPQAQELAFSAPFSDLLFYERLAHYADVRQRGRDFESSALHGLEELVTLASDSARLPTLGDIYYGDGRVSRVAEALRGEFSDHEYRVWGGAKGLTCAGSFEGKEVSQACRCIWRHKDEKISIL